MLTEIDARVSSGTLIEWGFDPESDTHTIRILDDDGMWSLHPRNGAEALDMFKHTFTYDWTHDVPNAMKPESYIIGEGREFTAPRS